MEQAINILIVDDEPKNLTVLATVLDDPGYRLVQATSAEQALLALVEEQFALLILDIRMPGMSGLELAQAIKARKKTAQVPIIFLTAYGRDERHVLQGYGSGAVDYLHKPVDPAVLRSKVAVFAELYRKHREGAAANRALLGEIAQRRRAEGQLCELNRTLEQRVAERTQALEASLHEKDALLQEVHHRVKNNLQIVASLLSLQAGCVSDPQTLVQFQESQQRIRSMALIHEKLYQSATLATLDLADYVQALASAVLRSYGAGTQVEFDARLAPTPVSMDSALPVGLILNELVTNALKYAFPDGRRGCLGITLGTEADGRISLRVQDDGVGLQPGFRVEQAQTLGLRLVRMFARQLHADLTLRSAPGHTVFEIRFKEPAPAAASPAMAFDPATR
ncbi:MAG: histidine kinase dimerization/phosphoacceptor domain -containing protein [Burkholderiaceae bacterium]